jgi:DNA-binding HxlR family transcriptional regulator
MAEGSYNQFCPVAMASEILCTRWTLIVLRELICGSTRFNELRRGVPRMSPALLSKRLKELEAAGVVSRTKSAAGPDLYEYRLTAAGEELKPIIEQVGVWGHRWVSAKSSLDNLDPNLLMWDIRRRIAPKAMPQQRRHTIQVILQDQPESKRNWWLVVGPGDDVDLCVVDPGFEVDLYLVTDLRTMTEIWMGYTTIARAKADEKLVVTGSRELEAGLETWLGLSSFAGLEKRVA